MPDTTDPLAEHLDAAIGAAPQDTLELEQLLSRGRRAQARRRLAIGAGTAAAVAVLAGAAWTLSPGGASTAPATDPAAPPAGDPPDTLARYDGYTGELTVAEGWTVQRRIDDPITGPAAADFAVDLVDDSVGLLLTSGDEVAWVVAWYGTQGADDADAISGTITSGPGEDFETFPLFLEFTAADVSDTHAGEWGHTAALLDAEGQVQVKPGWFVAERVEAPTGPGSVAVDVSDGERHQWFVFDRQGGEISDIVGDPTDPRTPDASYADFRAWVDDVVAGLEANQTPDEGRR